MITLFGTWIFNLIKEKLVTFCARLDKSYNIEFYFVAYKIFSIRKKMSRKVTPEAGCASSSMILKSNRVSKRESDSAREKRISFSFALMVALFGLVVIGSQPSSAFPDGAPGEACTRHKPNHGGTAQPLSAMPFIVTASSSTYNPGQSIAGKLR